MAPRSALALVTGFEPFGGDDTNPSWEVAQRLHGRVIAADGGTALRVQAVQLPCVFGLALQVLDAAITAHRPRVVLALGLAANRSELSVERVAVNLDDARIADNAGGQPLDAPVVPGAPAAYFSRLPVKAMVAAAQAAGVPAVLSHTAGSFVCNHVFYGLMHRLRRRHAVRAGFVHVPATPGMPLPPGVRPMSLDDQVRGVAALLAASLRPGADLAARGGAVS